MSLRDILGFPSVYMLLQRLIVSDKAREEYVRRHIRPEPGGRILDIGCGTGSILENLPDVDYHGFDANARYIEDAVKRYNGRGNFHQGYITVEKIDRPGSFDIVLAKGILHHLNDDEAGKLADLALTALKPGGRMVTLDQIHAPGQSWLARFLISRDRGRYVRDREGYVSLVRDKFTSVNDTMEENRARLPYTYLIMECVK